MERGILYDFNSARERNLTSLVAGNGLAEEAIGMINKRACDTYPLIYMLLTNTTRFYEKYFPQLLSCIAREKRQLVFETPNRVKMQYEYELERNEALTEDAYYLFNTRSRLSWLVVEMESKQVAVASNQVVKQKLSMALNGEDKKLAKALGMTQEDILTILYNNSEGKPCFVNYYKNTKSIRISYFDSMQQPTEMKSFFFKKLFNPIAERQINYAYRPLAPFFVNKWLYIKAPEKFAVEAIPNKCLYESVPTTDKEVKSFVLTYVPIRGRAEIDIRIKVPLSMKVWYYTMLWIPIVILISLPLIYVAYKSNYISCYTNQLQTFLLQIPKGIYAIIAAILATRGWLINEEYVLGRLSQWYTVLIILLLIEVCGLLLLVPSCN